MASCRKTQKRQQLLRVAIVGLVRAVMGHRPTARRGIKGIKTKDSFSHDIQAAGTQSAQRYPTAGWIGSAENNTGYRFGKPLVAMETKGITKITTITVMLVMAMAMATVDMETGPASIQMMSGAPRVAIAAMLIPEAEKQHR